MLQGTPTSAVSGPQINAYVGKYDHFLQVLSFSCSTCFPLLGNVKFYLKATQHQEILISGEREKTRQGKDG